MPEGDQLDDFTVFLYRYTLILLLCLKYLDKALFDDKKQPSLFKVNVCLCNALPEKTASF